MPVVKNPSANAGDVRDPGSIPGREDPQSKKATRSGMLAWEIPQRSLVGYSSRCQKELDETKHYYFYFNSIVV